MSEYSAIKGYCMLKSTNTVKGYAGDTKELLPPNTLRIMEIAVDGNSFLVLNANGSELAMIEKEDIEHLFYCSVHYGVICPPDINYIEKLEFLISRQSIKGGYNSTVASLVILNSLLKGYFTDDFLFQNQ